MLWNNQWVNEEIKGQLKKKQPLIQMKIKRKHTKSIRFSKSSFKSKVYNDTGPPQEIPRSISELWCKVDRIGVFPLGKESLIIPLPELFTCQCTLLCHLLPIVRAYKIHSFWHCL